MTFKSFVLIALLPQENEKLKETNIILESKNQDLSYQLEDWAVINKMDTSDRVSDGKIPHSQKNIRQFHVFLSKENYVPPKKRLVLKDDILFTKERNWGA